MSDPNEPVTELTADQVRNLAARRHQLDLEAWRASEPPIPAYLPPPDEVARRVLARAGVTDHRDEVGQAIAAAVAEAEALPRYERPATAGEMARWVKTRLHGHAPLAPERAVAFLLAFAANELRRPRGEAVNDWSRVPADSLRSTVRAAGGATDDGLSRLPRAVTALLDADPAAGELLLLSEYAGQTADALAELKRLTPDDVRRELAVALAWVRDEMELAAGAAPTE